METQKKQAVSETKTFRLPSIICQKIDQEVKRKKEENEAYTLSNYGVEVFTLHFAQKDYGVNNANAALELQKLQNKYTSLQSSFDALKQENESLLSNQKDEKFELQIHEKIQQYEATIRQKDEIIRQMQYTSPSGQIPTLITLKDKEIEAIKAENTLLKTKLKAIGETFTKVTGYYYNAHFSKLKTQIIEIVTSF